MRRYKVLFMGVVFDMGSWRMGRTKSLVLRSSRGRRCGGDMGQVGVAWQGRRDEGGSGRGLERRRNGVLGRWRAREGDG